MIVFSLIKLNANSISRETRCECRKNKILVEWFKREKQINCKKTLKGRNIQSVQQTHTYCDIS